jgi:predicted dehydrogenase
VLVVVHGTGSIGSRHLRVLDRIGVPARGVSVRAGTAFPADATAAIIATSTGRHVDDAIAALRAGCHVLVEKPVAPSTAGLGDLDRVARETQHRVFVGCTLRFDAALLRFRALLPRIGRVGRVHIECRSYLPNWRPGTDYTTSYSAQADEGGVLRDLIHEIDYAGWLFGWPEQVTARIGNTGALGIASEEWADLAWDVGETHVAIHLDYLTRPPCRFVRAHGEHGTLEVDLIGHWVMLDTERISIPQDRDDMLRDQTTAFVAALGGGAAGQLATLVEGGKAIAICDAARASNGAPVAVCAWNAA